MNTLAESEVLLADGVWVAAALLHREHEERQDFSDEEIKSRFLEEGLPRGAHTNSLSAQIGSHCVANKPRSRNLANPSKLQGGAYRLLYETRPGYKRLYRPGDDAHPDRIQPRKPSKQLPKREELPPKYRPLLDWYEQWVQKTHTAIERPRWEDDPLIRLVGSGGHIWADEHADEYVNRLREEPA
jgi:hypothetical protein